MKLTLALLVTGILIIAGTAGESDVNTGMPLTQFLAQSLVGLGLFGWGVVRSQRYS